MTIKDCIDIVDNIKPNQYTIKEKVMWLSFIEEIIINEVLKTHEGYDGRYDDFAGYTEDKLSVTLIVPSPYNRLYTAYLKMKIDQENGETARYNNSMVLYNTYMTEYRKHYNKTHMPLDTTGRKNVTPPIKSNVGLSDAEYENLKKDMTYILTEYFSNSVSPDKLSAIVNDYVQNNIEMLKGKDGLNGRDGCNPDKVKGYIPLSETYDSITNKTKIVLTSVAGLEVGHYIAKYIVAEPNPKWQSREILSIDTTANAIVVHAKFDTQISGALNENSSLEDGILVYGDCTKGVVDVQYSKDMTLVKAYVDGDYNTYGFNANVEGNSNQGLAISSHTEGDRNITTGISSHNEGSKNNVSGKYAHGEGTGNKVAAENSHGEGATNTLTVEAKYAHVEGWNNLVTGYVSHGEGYNNTVSGYCNHGEGYDNEVSGYYAHVQGAKNMVSGNQAHGEGHGNTVTGQNAHGEGNINTVTGSNAHGEGYNNEVSGSNSHGEGANNIVSGQQAHGEGVYTIAASNQQHVQGRFNVADVQGRYVHIVGGGTSDSNRKNIHTIDWNGNAEFAGAVSCASVILTSPNGKKFKLTVDNNGTLATEALNT